MISKLIEKLSKPHWMPSDPRILVSNLTPEHIGQLNLMWVMLGRINITANFFKDNLDLWATAGNIAAEPIQGATVRDFATLYNEAEFYDFLQKNQRPFTNHLPLQEWRKIFAPLAPLPRKNRHKSG